MKNHKLLNEEISKDVWGKWTIDGLYNWYYYFDGKESNAKEIDKLLESVGLNIQSNDLARMIGEFKGSKLSNIKPLLIGIDNEGEEIYLVPEIEFSQIEEYHKEYKEVSLEVHCGLSTKNGDVYLFGIVGLFKVGHILNFDFSLTESKKENKNMKKTIKERFEAPRDWDFDEMIEEYGREYLGEHDPDREPFEMDMIDEFYNKPSEALQRAFFGERYGWKGDSFNPNDDYFAYNGYGNLVSIEERDLDDYIKDNIDEPYFYDWCVEQGYFESEEDE